MHKLPSSNAHGDNKLCHLYPLMFRELPCILLLVICEKYLCILYDYMERTVRDIERNYWGKGAIPPHSSSYNLKEDSREDCKREG